MCLFKKKEKYDIIEISDILPKGERPIDYVMQLQNELAKYIKVEDGKVKIKIAVLKNEK